MNGFFRNPLIWGTMTFGAASIAYVFYEPSHPRQKKSNSNSISGLVNNGTNCFVNTILQALAGCSCMISWLKLSLQNCCIHFDDQSSNNQNYLQLNSDKKPLIKSLLKTLQSLNKIENQFNEASPFLVLNALNTYHWKIFHGEQDAHELFNILTSVLEIESYSLPLYSLKDALVFQNFEDVEITKHIQSFARISTRASKCLNNLCNSLPRALPTKGLLASQLECINCNFKYPVHLDIFYSISLALPNTPCLGIPLLFQDCLDKFISNEIIQEVKCNVCSKSGTNSMFSKKLTFAKLPQLLCFHIHRLVWLNNGTTLKRTEHILAPEFLNMDKYVYSKQHSKLFTFSKTSKKEFNNKETSKNNLKLDINPKHTFNQNINAIQIFSNGKYRFRLCSTIVHLGDSMSGHFVTYRRGNEEDDNTWFYASDTIIRQVTIEDVLSKPAYMLFYERVYT